MKKKMTEKEIENQVNDVAASFAMEDMHVTEQEKEIGRKILRGELDGKKFIKEYVAANTKQGGEEY